MNSRTTPMNIKVAAFTVSGKSINTQFLLCLKVLIWKWLKNITKWLLLRYIFNVSAISDTPHFIFHPIEVSQTYCRYTVTRETKKRNKLCEKYFWKYIQVFHAKSIKAPAIFFIILASQIPNCSHVFTCISSQEKNRMLTSTGIYK